MNTHSPGAARIVRLGPEHSDALAEMESLCFSQPWSASSFQNAFQQNVFSVLGVWAEKNPAELDGYIAFYHTQDELEILNIAVRENSRRRGLGRELLLTALQTGEKAGILSAVLEVRVSNIPAIRLYEKAGFQPAGRRKAYYQDTGEDALVYTLTFHGENHA